LKRDIENNKFDTSLQKYKILTSSLLTSIHTTPAAKIPEATSSKKQDSSDYKFAQTNNTAEKGEGEMNIITLFELWTTQYRNMSCEHNVDYNLMRRMLRRWQISSVDEVLIKLQDEKFSENTYNMRLSMLKQFFNWLVKKKHIPDNPLDEVTRKKRKKNKKERSSNTQTFLP